MPATAHSTTLPEPASTFLTSAGNPPSGVVGLFSSPVLFCSPASPLHVLPAHVVEPPPPPPPSKLPRLLNDGFVIVLGVLLVVVVVVEVSMMIIDFSLFGARHAAKSLPVLVRNRSDPVCSGSSFNQPERG